MSLTRVPYRTTPEIADVVNMLADRVSFFESRYENSPTKLLLVDFLFELRIIKKF